MADFNIVIKVDSGGAVRSAKNVEGALRRVENRANKTEQVLKRAFAGVAAGQGAVQSIRFLANFSQEMSTVKAISKATDVQFKELRETAIDLGTTTRFTSKQAASGMLFLARSGYEVQEILETIPGVLNLAQAGALDLGRAADITTNILKGFGIDTAETARVVDVLALSANSANTTVEQMGQAMKFVAPIASGVRMSLEDTAAAIQVLSNAGIQASMAGTGLRRVIGALEGPTTSQERILHQLGLTTDDVKVSQVGLAGALGAIRSKTNDVGTMLKLFGQRGGPAGEVMAKMASEMTAFGIANTFASKEMGEASRVAKIMDDNLNGALLRVKSAFQGLLILFGDVSTVSALRKILDGLAEALRFLARNAKGLNDAIAVLIVGFLAYRAALIKVSMAQIKWGALMKVAIGPQIIIALTAIIALIVLFQDQLTIGGEGFVTFGHLGQAAANQINNAFLGMSLMMGQSGDKAESGWSGVFSNIVTMGLAMVQQLAYSFDKIVGFFIGLWKGAAKIKDLIVQVFDNAWIDLANGANKWVQTAINFWVNAINGLADKLHLGDAFKIDPVAFTDPLAKMPPEALITGDDVGKAFLEGLQRSGLEDAFLSLLTDAERLAIQEIKLPGVKEDKPFIPKADKEIYGPDVTADRGNLPSFRELLNEIRMETELLKLSSREYEIQQGLLDMQDQLKRNLTTTERVLATTALQNLQAQQEMTRAYDEIRGPMEDLIAKHTALNGLLRSGTISLTEYGIAMDKVKIAQLQLNTDMQSGLERGLLKIKQQLQDVATVAETVLVNAFSSAEDALAEFSTTGQINFSQLIDGILQDLTRLLVRQALLNLIPGLGPAAGAIPVIKSATGSDFMVGGSGGTDSQRFIMDATPGERVTVQTPAQQKDSQPASQPNIKIVNVSDPNEIADAMSSREGEIVILNTIRRNPNAVRSSL